MAKNTDKYEMIDISELHPYENNARTHSDSQLEAICNSIKEFGFINPVIIDENNMILVGHGRIEASKILGLTKAPYRRVTNLTDDQKRAYILADNRLSDLGGWDEELLAQELENISLDMSAFGFEDFNIDIDEPEPEIVEDDFDVDGALEMKSRVERGQVWKLGEHRLMCGDSTSLDDVGKLMDGKKADMVFTDPPYGYEYQSNFRVKTEKFDVLKNDDKILDFFPSIKKFCDGFVMVCTMWKVLDKWIPLFGEYFDLTNMIIWEKGGGSMGDLKKTFGTDYEIILTSNNGKEIVGKRLMSVWKITRDDLNSYQHPTQKPVALPAQAIEHTTNKNANVLDLFGGSGSTLIACEQTNRKCFMMELDEHYCEVIIQRWESLTGKKAELIK